MSILGRFWTLTSATRYEAISGDFRAEVYLTTHGWCWSLHGPHRGRTGLITTSLAPTDSAAMHAAETALRKATS